MFFLFHQTVKELVKTHIFYKYMKEGSTKNKMIRRRYGKSQIQCYNCKKIGHYVYEIKSTINNMERKTNYGGKKKVKNNLLNC